MKKLIIAAMLFVGIASFAQDATGSDAKPQREKMTPEQRNDKQLKKLTSELNLDANQQTQVKQLLADRSAKAEQFKEARMAKKDSNTKPTAEEKAAFKKQMTDEVAANDAKMKSILNADQYTKWKAIQEENKDKFKEKMKERRENQ
jgi:protein CpxP